MRAKATRCLAIAHRLGEVATDSGTGVAPPGHAPVTPGTSIRCGFPGALHVEVRDPLRIGHVDRVSRHR